jgi:hypothetical protein
MRHAYHVRQPGVCKQHDSQVALQTAVVVHTKRPAIGSGAEGQDSFPRIGARREGHDCVGDGNINGHMVVLNEMP